MLVCLLFGSFCKGQAANSKCSVPADKPAAPAAGSASVSARDQSQATNSTVGPDTPVITINGLCESSSDAAISGCKTVITRSQFEKMIEALQPNMTARARREFALQYAQALVIAKRAEGMGLDKGASYEEQMKVARIEVLSKELNKAIREKMSQVADKDIEDYYRDNRLKFETAELDRLFVPKTRQQPTSIEKLSEAETPERSQESGEIMKEEAYNLHARAVAGEEFTKLQADAYRVAGIKSAASNTSIAIRRISLPPNQASVLDLEPGEVSSVLADPNGYVVYKLKAKETLPLDQAREEIRVTLRSLRMRDEVNSIQDSAIPALDESYFRPSRPIPNVVGPSEASIPASKPYSSKQ
jgi:PPIC-type PPIASE domain